MTRIIEPEGTRMKQFQKLLVVFDSKERDRPTLDLALQLARDAGGSVTLVHVLPPLPQDLPEDLEGLKELKETLGRAAEAELRSVVGELPETRVPVATRVLSGHLAMELTREVLRNGHDLVMKSAGRANRISGQLMASADMRLLRNCPCPVWLVKTGETRRLKKVLATVDPGNSREPDRSMNKSILELGLSLAGMEGAEFHVLHAWSVWGRNILRHRMRSAAFNEYVGQMRSRAARGMTDLLRGYDDLIPLLCRHLVEGDPEEVVPEFARAHDVDVIVMGTVGRTGIPGFVIGNTAETILGEVDCSVLAVKPVGFATPVELDG